MKLTPRHTLRSSAPRVRALSLLAAAASSFVFPLLAAAQPYDCVIVPAQSNVSASLTFSTTLVGTLIGTYTAANLTGSRTKGGLFGSFGSTENVAIPISIAAGINNTPVTTALTGDFLLSLDLDGLTASISGYSTSLFSTSPLVIPVTANITIPSFRTRNPTSAYIAATVPVPLGNANITLFRTTQDGSASGSLTFISATEYDVIIPISVLYTLQGDVAGSPIDSVGTTPSPALFTGRVTITPSGIQVRSTGAISFSDDQMPNTVLPQVAFDLPTILPPGLIVPVLLDLSLTRAQSALSGTQTFFALGTAPACFADFNADGGVDGADVDNFFDVWVTGNTAADVNQDGGVDGADVDLFFVQWSAGGC